MKTPAISTSLKRVFLSAIAASSLFTASHAFGQINGVGPSDPALFTNVFNIPTDPDIGNSQSFGGVAGETTQLNLSDGGTIGSQAEFNSGVEINIDGGLLRRDAEAIAGSEVNISGGTIGTEFRISGAEANISGGLFEGLIAISGGEEPSTNTVTVTGGIFNDFHYTSSTFQSPVNAAISGGNFRDDFTIFRFNDDYAPTGQIELIGGDFQVNGRSISGTTFSLNEGDVFTGTLQDGSGFLFSDETGDEIEQVTLTRVPLPVANTNPIVVNTPQTLDALVRSGQTLTVQDGGELEFTQASGATVNITGGSLSNGEVFDSTVNVSGGTASFFSLSSEINISGGVVEGELDAYSSEINVTGGTASRIRAISDTVVNIGGGSVSADAFSADSVINVTGGTANVVAINGGLINISGGTVSGGTGVGATVNISGDAIITSFRDNNSDIFISGGTFLGNYTKDFSSDVSISGGSFESLNGNRIDLIGGDFQLNGEDFSGSTLDNFSNDDVLTGTFQDGSSFIFSPLAGSRPSALTLISDGPLPSIDTTPIVVNTITSLSGLREGQTLTLQDGGDLTNFRSVGGTLNVEGGNIGRTALVTNSVVNISEGTIGNGFKAFLGSEINISGGTVGDSETFGRFTTVYDSTVNITGGNIERGFQAERSTINITGGTFLGEEEESSLIFSDGSVANISGVVLDRIQINSGSEVNFSGSNAFAISAGDDSRLAINSGTTGISATDNSNVDISGGNITFLSAFGDSTVNISGGNVGDDANVFDGGTVNIRGGNVGDNFGADFGGTVNINGGSVGNNFDASNGGLVNISGGQVGIDFQANDGSQVNINGGTLGSDFAAQPGSDVTVSGGQFAEGFTGNFGSTVAISGGNFGTGFRGLGAGVELQGGEFRLNGFDVSALPNITINVDAVLTGTLADGSSFIFSNRTGDFINNVTLSNVALPTLDTTPIVVTTPLADRPIGLRAGQSLTLQDGGDLGNNFEAVDAVVNLQAGTIGDGFGTARSTVNIDGGTIGNNFFSHAGSVVNVNGGTIGDDFTAGTESEVVINGGRIGQRFGADFNSRVRIIGGIVGRGFVAAQNSDVQLSGGEFQLNGEAFSGSTISIAAGDVFTGTLTDGSAFIFNNEVGDSLNNVQLNQTAVPEVDITPVFVSSLTPNAPSSLRSGQTLTLEQGGIINSEFETIGGVININGGSFADDTAFFNTTVNLNDGSIAGEVAALAGSELNLFGGTIDGLVAGFGSEINLHGGVFQSRVFANAGSAIDVFATEFSINGQEIDFADLDSPLLIDARDFSLSGVFTDGTEFQYFVGSFSSGDLTVSPNAILQLNLVATAVPEPSAAFFLALSGMVMIGRRRKA